MRKYCMASRPYSLHPVKCLFLFGYPICRCGYLRPDSHLDRRVQHGAWGTRTSTLHLRFAWRILRSKIYVACPIEYTNKLDSAGGERYRRPCFKMFSFSRFLRRFNLFLCVLWGSFFENASDSRQANKLPILPRKPWTGFHLPRPLLLPVQAEPTSLMCRPQVGSGRSSSEKVGDVGCGRANEALVMRP